MTNYRLRTGDTVHHKPSGEEWVVAYADYSTGKLSPCGWPECEAEIMDCSLVRAAPDQESAALLDRLVASGERRGRRAKEIAEAANAAA